MGWGSVHVCGIERASHYIVLGRCTCGGLRGVRSCKSLRGKGMVGNGKVVWEG